MAQAQRIERGSVDRPSVNEDGSVYFGFYYHRRMKHGGFTLPAELVADYGEMIKQGADINITLGGESGNKIVKVELLSPGRDGPAPEPAEGDQVPQQMMAQVVMRTAVSADILGDPEAPEKAKK